jgi:hemerythrin
LKEIWLKEHVLDMDSLKGIQETIAGFLNEHVLKPDTKFYFNPDEPLKPNLDKHLYDI